MANNSKKKAITYTYKSVDGSTQTIRIGEDGVTKKMILLLRDSDREMELQDRYQEENSSFEYRNAVERFEKISNDDEDHPLNRIEDPKADIMEALFPDPEEDSMLLKKLEDAMNMLTNEQHDLIYELYGLLRTISEIAREQNVSRAAIQNRRTKILKKIQKMVEAQEP